MILQNRNYGCRITCFAIGRVPAVSLENDRIRVGILTGKGGDIYEFLHKPTDTDAMYRSAPGLRLLEYPQVSMQGAGGVFWENFVGGWFEMLPNAGNACRFQGADFGTHGEVMLLPWTCELAEDTTERVSVALRTRTLRSPFRVEKRFTLERDSDTLRVEETVENESDLPATLQWGQHITMGEALLNEHCRIELAPARVQKPEAYDCSGSRLLPSCEGDWTRMPGKDGGAVDLSRLPPDGVSETLFADLSGEGWFQVTDEKKRLRFRVEWDGALFPALWVWQEFGYTKDYPFYGGCRAMALEPMTGNTPTLAAAAEDGSAMVLPARASVSTVFTASLGTEYMGR